MPTILCHNCFTPHDSDHWCPACNPTQDTWKTKDGTLIRVRDMDHQHLTNTRSMLRRMAFKEWAAAFEPYPHPSVQPMDYVPDIYHVIDAEIKRRADRGRLSNQTAEPQNPKKHAPLELKCDRIIEI